jgi:type VI secretion system protein ImpK
MAHDPNDPFGGPDDEDRTIIRPNPGRRATAQTRASEPGPVPAGPPIDVKELSGLNPLEKAASLLLNLLGQIRNTNSHPNPTALHQQLAEEIRQFEKRAQNAGAAPETIFTARYVLCTTIDEFVLSTPWGASSVWRNQSLLRLFHQETGGGDKFFLLLHKLIDDPARNIDLLELIYVCLALGFQGRYAVEQDGRNTLEAVRENLYRTIKNFRGDTEPTLSLHWEGIDKSLEHRRVRLPMWAMVAIALALLSFVYLAFSFNLNRHTEPLYVAFSTTGTEDNLLPARSLSPVPVRRIADPTPDRFSLKIFLAPEISRGQVTVDEQPEKTVVLIHGDGLFDSGVDVIKPAYLPILNRIGEGLESTNGRIIVTGHTDNVPISTRQFPSNRALSQARADEVMKYLQGSVSNRNRLSARGMAATKPIASNASPQDRAKNRRVEITVHERSKGG